MVDNRTSFSKDISTLLRETYGGNIKVFSTDILHSVRAAEISAEGKSIFAHDPMGKVALGHVAHRFAEACTFYTANVVLSFYIFAIDFA